LHPSLQHLTCPTTENTSTNIHARCRLCILLTALQLGKNLVLKPSADVSPSQRRLHPADAAGKEADDMDNEDSGAQIALAAAVLSVSQYLHHLCHQPLLKCDIFGSPASTHGLGYGSLGFVYCAGANWVGEKGAGRGVNFLGYGGVSP